MTTRRQKGKKAEVDVGQLLSQLSTSSDDVGIMAAIQKTMKAATEKKRKERGEKFIQVATKELQDLTSAALEVAKTTLHVMDAAFAKFVIEYATVEDEIRTILVQIQQEQETMAVLSERHVVANTEGAKETEKGQIEGMARAKEACQDISRIVDSITSVVGH